MATGYKHAILTRDKSSAAFQQAITHVVAFYNLHGHRVTKLRCDAGSTENAAETVQFLREYDIDIDPAAVGEQQQNPVEREVQTANKGISALLIDQTAVGPTYWDYAVESWVMTANATAYDGGECPLTRVTGKTANISTTFLFPFGCSVSCLKPKGRESHFDTKGEYGIALGSVSGSNTSVLVLLPGHGKLPFERVQCKPLLFKPPPGSATGVLELELKTLVYSDDLTSVTFDSAAPNLDSSEDRGGDTRPGTLGTSMFSIPAHPSQSKSNS
jgi:hypothetical protein